MRKILILAATSAFLLAGCNSLPERHAAAGGMTMSGMGGAMGGQGGMPMDMEKHMQSMQAMHEKMAAAKTPAERQALMQEHMKMMQEGCR